MIWHTFPGPVDIVDRLTWPSGGRLTAVTAYPGSGTASDTDTTWTCPANLHFIVVRCVGGGAGGGYATGTAGVNCAIGSGGGAGGWTMKVINSDTLAALGTVTVRAGHGGTGGTVGTPNVNAAVGTDSTFGIAGDTLGVLCTGQGGTAGGNQTSGNTGVWIGGGSGGLGTGGDFNGAGGDGAWGNRVDGANGFGGDGGSVGPWGAGGKSVLVVGAAGNPGRGFGGGGGGGGSTGATGRNGGDGAPGMVLVYEYSL